MSEDINNLPEFNLPGDDSPKVEDQTPAKEETKIEADPNAQAIFNIYRDEGFIKTEEFDGTYDGLRQALLQETQTLEDNVFNAIVESPPEFAKPVVDLVLSKGQDLTKEELFEFVDTLRQVDITEDNLQPEQFLTKYYKENMGWDDEDINDRLETLKDKEKLEAEAKMLFKRQNETTLANNQAKLEEARQQRETVKQQQKEFITDLSSSLSSSYQRPKAQKLYNEFMTGSFKNKLEDILTKPDLLHQLVDFISYYDGEKFNMDTFKKEAFSPDVNKVQKNVQKYWSSSNLSGSVEQDPSTGRKVDLTKGKFVD
jgi:hypothetical protein